MTAARGAQGTEAAAGPVAARPRRRRINWKKVGLAALIVVALIAFATQGGRFDFEELKAHRAELLAYTQRHYVPMLVGAILVYIAATA
ncbi:MAG TPA: hypothetical protein VGX50_17405, partial [Longimicrobium sp.]|nr:hypothetical protein [Longimicrobium sp.]